MSMAAVLDAIVLASLEVTGGLDAWLAVPDGEDLVIVSATGSPEVSLRGLQLPAPTGSAHNTIATGQPMAMRIRGDGMLDARIIERLGRQPESILSIPCEYDDRPVGALEIVDAQTGSFSIDDVEVVTQFGAIAAVSLVAMVGPGGATDAGGTRGGELARRLHALEANDQGAFDRVAAVLDILLGDAP